MTVSWWTIALQAINFLVLVWLLHRFLYRPALAVMARRKQLVEEAFGKAEDAKQAAEAEQDSFRKKQAELDESRQALLTRTHQEIAADRENVLAEARRQADTLLDDTREQLARERKAALAEIKVEVADLAHTMATRLLEQIGADPDTRAGLTQAALNQVSSYLDGLPEAERRALADDLGKSTDALTVVTAADLDEATRERWLEVLAARLGERVTVRFSAEPALLGGAELRFPHSVICLTWSEQLEQGRTALLADDVAH